MGLSTSEVELLACPECRVGLDASGVRFVDEVLEGGAFRCAECGRRYEVRRGIPFFAPWADDLSRAEDRPTAFATWARAHAHYRDWHEHRWNAEGARRARPLFDAFWAFAGAVEGCGVDIGGGRSLNREWNPKAQIWSVDPESSWVLDPPPKFMASMYRCWDQPFPFVQAVGERLPLKARAFDFAIIQGALDHVADPEAVIAEARRVLRPGGTLWLMVTTADLEREVPRLAMMRRHFARARRNPRQLLIQGPVRFFSEDEEAIEHGHVSAKALTRANLDTWLSTYRDKGMKEVSIDGMRQLFVRASRPE
ncbi:MAG: methyltransferase domain-containing protein [Deltaproteobacteria bacterium]|nr:methyltransferase domain-containing protein [Deltaproteobacteria bacterium]